MTYKENILHTKQNINSTYTVWENFIFLTVKSKEEPTLEVFLLVNICIKLKEILDTWDSLILFNKLGISIKTPSFKPNIMVKIATIPLNSAVKLKVNFSSRSSYARQ